MSDPFLMSCSDPFNEGLLWQEEEATKVELEKQLTRTFHNITKLMDCVGCEKCKMWGKIQILGIATALKILFSQHQETEMYLHRNEVIALIVMLAKSAQSVEWLRDLSTKVQYMNQS